MAAKWMRKCSTHRDYDTEVVEQTNNKIMKFAELCLFYLGTIRSHRDINQRREKANKLGNQTAWQQANGEWGRISLQDKVYRLPIGDRVTINDFPMIKLLYAVPLAPLSEAVSLSSTVSSGRLYRSIMRGSCATSWATLDAAYINLGCNLMHKNDWAHRDSFWKTPSSSGFVSGALHGRRSCPEVCCAVCKMLNKKYQIFSVSFASAVLGLQSVTILYAVQSGTLTQPRQ